MIIQNVSSIPVLAIFNGTEIVLTAGEAREISCLGKMNLGRNHKGNSAWLGCRIVGVCRFDF